MTHFTVLVRIPSATEPTQAGLLDVVTKLMIPWQEHACTGACPIEFMEFTDREDEYLAEFNGSKGEDGEEDDEPGSSGYVVIGPAAEGDVGNITGHGETEVKIWKGQRIVRPWHDMFRVKGSIGIGGGTHKVPEQYSRVNVPHKDLYATLEQFVADYHGAKNRDPIKNRYGRWENPEKKWDGWRPIHETMPIVGRKKLGDIARIAELDTDRLAAMTKERVEDIWKTLDDVRAGRTRRDARDPSRVDHWWAMDAREIAVDYGILQCISAEKMTDEFRARYRCVKQDRNDKLEVFDCWDDREQFSDFVDRATLRCHPLRTWARVESSTADGNRGGSEWTEPGRMGWFGFHSGEAKAIDDYAKAFVEWLHFSGDKNDYVLKLDCHI